MSPTREETKVETGTRWRIAFESARLQLAGLSGHVGTTGGTCGRALRISALALRVERVGLWMLRDHDRALECIDLHVLSSGDHQRDEPLRQEQVPAYFEALQQRRAIVAPDARREHSTRMLAPYLEARGISSLLDVPIIRDGHVVGVVRHEHVGAPRKWTQADMGFATAVADAIASIFELEERMVREMQSRHDAIVHATQARMEALGRLACSVAHDFNNTLATIVLIATHLSRDTDPRIAESGSSIVEAAGISTRLARQLLLFGRDRTPEERRVALDVLLARVQPVMVAAAGSGTALTIRSTATCCETIADPSLLEQIVLNLCLNAREAMGAKSGHIEVRVRDPQPTDEFGDSCVVLEVADDGEGMDESTRAHIFEPYFTTKSEGTGLGLATVQGIVAHLGGKLFVASEVGRGTTFTIALPRAPALPAHH